MTITMSLYSQLISEYAPEPWNLHINKGINELSNNNMPEKRIDWQYLSQIRRITQEYQELKNWRREGERKGRMR